VSVDPAQASWPALGTTATVVVTDATALEVASDRVRAELEAIDAACSRFRPDSELSRLNAARGRSVVVGALLFGAIAVALRAAALTDGAVDPTVGVALVNAGYDRDFASLPASGGPRPAIPVVPVSWRALRVDAAARRVAIPPAARLDLGATAKALAADRAAASVAAAVPGLGVLVSLGGDIAAAGPPPEGGWRVRVTDDHRAGPEAPGQTVTVRSGGLATSSTTARRWGAKDHHIIDPATGHPADAPWRTVSVAAASCVDANVASTAAIVLGAAAPDWLAQRALPSRLVAHDGTELALAGWPQEQEEA